MARTETFDQMLARRQAATIAILRLANTMSGKPEEVAALLIGAASVVIEREVGVAMAGATTLALIEPSLADWQRRAGAAADGTA